MGRRESSGAMSKMGTGLSRSAEMKYLCIVTYNGVSWIRELFLIRWGLGSTGWSGDCGQCLHWFNLSDSDKSIIQSVNSFKAQNLGFGKANNEGIQYALECGAEAVFLLNQDAILHSDTLEILLDIQKRNPDFGILSPIHCKGMLKILDYGFRNYLFATCNKLC